MRRSAHEAAGSLAALGAALGLFAIGIAIRDPDALTLPAPVHVAIGWSFVARASSRGGNGPRTEWAC